MLIKWRFVEPFFFVSFPLQLSFGGCFLRDDDALNVPETSIEFDTFDGSFLRVWLIEICKLFLCLKKSFFFFLNWQDIYNPVCGLILANMKTAYNYFLTNMRYTSRYIKTLEYNHLPRLGKSSRCSGNDLAWYELYSFQLKSSTIEQCVTIWRKFNGNSISRPF